MVLSQKINWNYFSSDESNKKHPFPCPTTYRTALTHYLDITHPPRTNVLYELAQYASDPKDQENMRKMASSSPEGKVSEVSWLRQCRNANANFFFSTTSRLFLTSSPQALYQSWVLDATRNILAILEDMPSLRPPIDHLCELLPRLQARYYSIASSSKVILYSNDRGKKFKAYSIFNQLTIPLGTFTCSQ